MNNFVNSVRIRGRLTKDPEVLNRWEPGTVVRFTVAVDREHAKEDGVMVDFLPCIAYGMTADFIKNHFSTGEIIELVGSLQSGSYKRDDGSWAYTLDIVCHTVGFGKGEKK